MKKLAVMSDLHIDLNHIQEEEQDLLYKFLKRKKLIISTLLEIFQMIL